MSCLSEYNPPAGTGFFAACRPNGLSVHALDEIRIEPAQLIGAEIIAVFAWCLPILSVKSPGKDRRRRKPTGKGDVADRHAAVK